MEPNRAVLPQRTGHADACPGGPGRRPGRAGAGLAR
jgi:hypothetical protein